MRLRLGPALTAFDLGVTAAVQRLPQSVGPVMSWASLVGLPPVGLSAVALLLVDAVLLGYNRAALAAVLVLLSAYVVDVIKRLVHRTRPDTVYVATRNPRGYSFPSGHAADAVLVYGLLGYLAAEYCPAPWGALAVSLAAAFVVLVSVSRVWLGAHFPSDVLGGWVVGGLLLLIALTFIAP